MLFRFKSRNADKHPRYSPHVVKYTAPKLEEKELKTLSVEEPRAKSKAPKNNNKVTIPSHFKPSNKPINLGRKAQGDGPAALKKLFQKAFQTVTLTLGSLKACLQRATDMTDGEAKLVAGRLETAVDLLTKTRSLVYKCLELFLISHLTSMDPENVAQEESLLDLVLHRTHGFTVIRNLVALVLNGVANTEKKPSSDQDTVRAQQLAQSMYDNLRDVLPDLQAIKGRSKIPLGTSQQALGEEIHRAIRAHFARLPETVVSKVTSTAADPLLLIFSMSNDPYLSMSLCYNR